jgi:hypothetical protein
LTLPKSANMRDIFSISYHPRRCQIFGGVKCLESYGSAEMAEAEHMVNTKTCGI